MGPDSSVPRLAMACWDYSWLTRRDGHQSEYRNLDLVMEGLALRGYNSLRVDPCPHLVCAAPNGLVLERFEIVPQGRELRRGASRPVQAHPRRNLLELLRAARNHGIRLWLASWFVPDTQARRSFVRRPADFVKVWAETLEFIRKEGFLEQVVAVDFCHEFPQAPWAHGAQRRLFGNNSALGLPVPLRLPLPWSDLILRRVESYLTEVPRALRALFPGVLCGVSGGQGLFHYLRQLDTTELDFLDHHLWLSDDPRFRVASGEVLPVPALLDGLQGRFAALVYRQGQKQWKERLRARLVKDGDFARIRRLLPVVSEGFVRMPAEHALDPRWVQAVSEQVILTALREDVRILTTGIHGRPHSPDFWDDVAWHQKMTQAILKAP